MRMASSFHEMRCKESWLLQWYSSKQISMDTTITDDSLQAHLMEGIGNYIFPETRCKMNHCVDSPPLHPSGNSNQTSDISLKMFWSYRVPHPTENSNYLCCGACMDIFQNFPKLLGCKIEYLHVACIIFAIFSPAFISLRTSSENTPSKLLD